MPKRFNAVSFLCLMGLIPLVAVVAGWLVLGESLSPVQGAACVAIVGGVVLGELGSPGLALETAEPPQPVTLPVSAPEEST